jgi:hypothetical protein
MNRGLWQLVFFGIFVITMATVTVAVVDLVARHVWVTQMDADGSTHLRLLGR